METHTSVEENRNFSVVRYYTGFAAGDMSETVAENLTVSEAKDLARKMRVEDPAEDVVVFDQRKNGIKAEVDR